MAAGKIKATTGQENLLSSSAKQRRTGVSAALRTAHFVVLDGKPLECVAAVRAYFWRVAQVQRLKPASLDAIDIDDHAILPKPEFGNIDALDFDGALRSGLVGQFEKMRTAIPAGERPVGGDPAIDQHLLAAPVTEAEFDAMAVDFGAEDFHEKSRCR